MLLRSASPARTAEDLALSNLLRAEVNSTSHSSSLTLDKLVVPHRAAITTEAAMQVALKA